MKSKLVNKIRTKWQNEKVNYEKAYQKLKNSLKIYGAAMMFWGSHTIAFATGDTGGGTATFQNITAGVQAIVLLVEVIVAGIGAINFLKNLSAMGTAINDRDQNGMTSALWGMVGGGIMALGGTVAALFGITV